MSRIIQDLYDLIGQVSDILRTGFTSQLSLIELLECSEGALDADITLEGVKGLLCSTFANIQEVLGYLFGSRGGIAPRAPCSTGLPIVIGDVLLHLF